MPATTPLAQQRPTGIIAPPPAAPLPPRRGRRVALATTLTALFLILNAIAVVKGWSPFMIPGNGPLPRLHHPAAGVSDTTPAALHRVPPSGPRFDRSAARAS